MERHPRSLDRLRLNIRHIPVNTVNPVNTVTLPLMKTILHIAVISHKHGTNEYAATSKENLDKKLGDFCREYWEDTHPEMQSPDHHATDSEWIDEYFTENDQEDLQYYGALEIDIPAPSLPPRELATILAALRIYQHQIDFHGIESIASMNEFQDGHTPLTSQEINELCDSINLNDHG